MHGNYERLIYFLKNCLKDENIKINESMKKHTTFNIGGPCDVMIFPESEYEFINSMKEIIDKKFPYFILGYGSNIIVKDGGIRGVVINLTKFNKISVKKNIINAKAGAKLCDISNIACENSLSGFEFACGIPGTIGGAVTMNAGAYGGEMSHIIHKVKVMDYEGNIFDICNENMDFGYRSTVIMKKKYIVIDCDILLQFGDKNEIQENINDFTIRRNLKQPLDYPSAGSVFKRPDGYFAGKLIEDSNLRGYIHKNAMVSDKHCGFIVNRSCANSKDVLELIDIIKQKVYENFKVELELEVRIIGEDKEN